MYRALALAACALTLTVTASSHVLGVPCPPPGSGTEETTFPTLPEQPTDLLSAFRLILGSTPAEAGAAVAFQSQDELRARATRYVHAAVSGEAGAGGSMAPEGMQVLGADLFFLEGERLIETSMVLQSDTSPLDAIERLESRWGAAEFAVVMPGSMHMIVGWKGHRSYAIGSFTDLPVFELSVFEEQPEDLLAGTQLILYEGLRRYARQLDEGNSPQDALPELLEVVRWVENARSLIEPRR